MNSNSSGINIAKLRGRVALEAAELKAVARESGGLTLSSAPEGFDALVMADIARAREDGPVDVG